MPSETVMVLNSTPLPPAPSAPAMASVASSLMCMLQGVRLAHVEATPICGFWKSASWKPTARSIARDGVCFAPSTTRREYCRASTPLLFFIVIFDSLLTGAHHAPHVRKPQRPRRHEDERQHERIHPRPGLERLEPLVDQDAGGRSDRAAHTRERDVHTHVVLRATDRSEVIVPEIPPEVGARVCHAEQHCATP